MSHLLTYPVQVSPAEEGGFYVTSPVLSIFTQGETKEEALENAKEAILCHIEGSAKQPGTPVVRMTLIQVIVPEKLVA